MTDVVTDAKTEDDGNTDKVATPMAILFADIGGSTSLYQSAGDSQAHQLISDSLNSMRRSVESAGGHLLRTVGDAVLARFESCDAACHAAIAIQESHRHSLLSVRVGFHWGLAISDRGDVYGNAVNIAARVSGLANTHEIMTTQEVVDRLSVTPCGPAQLLDVLPLRGVDKPLSIYRIPWEMQNLDTQTQVATSSELHGRRVVKSQLELSCAGKTLTLQANGQKCTLGRSENSTLQAMHTAASRVHATIECKQGKYVLEDVSTNGTYVIKDGQPFVFVHRDSVTLDGSGILATGFLPKDEDDSHGAIRFVTRQAED
jgi:class 3 adenylate cyclase